MTREPSLIAPPSLQSGDTVAAISLSSAMAHQFPQRYAVGKRQLEQVFGVTVVETEHALASAEELAARPDLRAADLHAALTDPSIAGIVSMIGGDDSIRVLPHVDLELIRAHPKPFVGFSDTTCTHMAFLAAGVTSFYGPSVLAGFGENAGVMPYTEAGVRTTMFGNGAAPGVWPEHEGGWTIEFLDWADPALQEQPRTLLPASGWQWLQPGTRCEGTLVVGCLEVLDWLRGSPWWPALDDVVLAVETSEEAPPPDAVVRMLRAMAAASDGFSGVRALLFGRPGGMSGAGFLPDMHPDQHPAYDEAVLAFVRDELGRSDMPVVTRMDFGHTEPQWTLPIGARTVVDPDARTVSFPDPCTTPR